MLIEEPHIHYKGKSEETYYNDLTSKVIGAAIEVHRELGPGLLESVYSHCFRKELKNRGLFHLSEIPLPVIYKGEILDKDFVIDFLIEDKVIVELKAVEELHPVHEVQLFTYLKLADKKLGQLINFNVPVLKNGIRRVINGYL